MKDVKILDFRLDCLLRCLKCPRKKKFNVILSYYILVLKMPEKNSVKGHLQWKEGSRSISKNGKKGLWKDEM
jgi:hypothetical protein